MQEPRTIEREPIFADGFYERDTPARARGFDERLHVGRTGRQTQPAAHALVVDVVGRDVASRKAEMTGAGGGAHRESFAAGASGTVR